MSAEACIRQGFAGFDWNRYYISAWFWFADLTFWRDRECWEWKLAGWWNSPCWLYLCVGPWTLTVHND